LSRARPGLGWHGVEHYLKVFDFYGRPRDTGDRFKEKTKAKSGLGGRALRACSAVPDWEKRGKWEFHNN
jgi:hypothetical protein